MADADPHSHEASVPCGDGLRVIPSALIQQDHPIHGSAPAWRDKALRTVGRRGEETPSPWSDLSGKWKCSMGGCATESSNMSRLLRSIEPLMKDYGR
jgi:hypothetical protein